VNVTVGYKTNRIIIFDNSLASLTAVSLVGISQQGGSVFVPINPNIIYPIGPSTTFTLKNNDTAAHSVFILEFGSAY